MDEQYFREHLSAYLDNELTPEERAMMDQHLAENPESRRLLEEMRGLDRLVEEHGGLSGGDYWECSAQKIEERLGIADTEVTELRSARPMRTGTFWKWISAVAAVLVLGYIGLHQSDILKKDLHDNVNHMPSPEVTPKSYDGTRIKHIDRDKIIPDSAGAESANKEEAESSEIPQANEALQPVIEQSQETQAAKVAKPAAIDEAGSEPGARKAEQSVEKVGIPKIEVEPGKDQVLSSDFSDVKIQQETKSAISAAPRAPQQTEEEKPPPPPPAPKNIPAEAATSDENYKRRAQDDITTEGDHEAAATVQPTEDSRLFGADDVSQLVAEELTRWRARRDTLIELSAASQAGSIEDSAKGHKDKILKGLSGESSNLRPQTATGWQSGKTDTVSIGGLQPLMVEAWFNICRLTADSLERDDGIRYLKSVADDTTSSEASRAREYLKRLGL